MTIYLVEEDSLIRSALQDFLSDLGHDVFVVNTLSELSDALDAHHPGVDLIIIDLPPADKEAPLLMRKVHEDHPDIPFVVMTVSGTLLPVEEALRCGVYAYLHKPIRFAELELVLARLAGQGRGPP
jgi:two-component system C4-dicarboxylate transport response regulator DctD